MKNLKLYTLMGIIFVIILGTLSHFLYDWSAQQWIIGFFTPVNESVWEHMKLLFFPMLIYSLFMVYHCRKDYPCVASSLCFGILTGTLFIPLFFYAYTFLLGKDIFVIDILIFIFSVILAFWISYKNTLSCGCKSHTLLLICLVSILFISFVIFTYRPPNLKLFEDPSPLQTNQFYSLRLS